MNIYFRIWAYDEELRNPSNCLWTRRMKNILKIKENAANTCKYKVWYLIPLRYGVQNVSDAEMICAQNLMINYKMHNFE